MNICTDTFGTEWVTDLNFLMRPASQYIDKFSKGELISEDVLTLSNLLLSQCLVSLLRDFTSPSHMPCYIPGGFLERIFPSQLAPRADTPYGRCVCI